MEDWNVLAADCVVISCCCQCLTLQVIIFILLKLPCKLFRKIKKCAKKRFRTRDRKKRPESLKGRFLEESVEIHEGSMRIQIEELQGGHGFGDCMREVERMLEDFSQKGEFAFGSFWGRQGLEGSSIRVGKQEVDISLVQFELVEIVNSFRCSS